VEGGKYSFMEEWWWYWRGSYIERVRVWSMLVPVSGPLHTIHVSGLLCSRREHVSVSYNNNNNNNKRRTVIKGADYFP
jgi:hypothetical protein